MMNDEVVNYPMTDYAYVHKCESGTLMILVNGTS